jgi:zinc transport system substrate-binding protein
MFLMKSRFIFITTVLCFLSLMSVACQDRVGSDAQRKKLVVVTTTFPLYDFSRSIGGPIADVSLLLPPGVEPHHFEPRPADIIKIQNSDIFVYTGPYMEPWVEKLLGGMGHKKFTIVDASAGIKLMKAGGHGFDPHIWLDFSKAVQMVDNVKKGFVERDAVHGDVFSGNARSYQAKLRELDRRYRESLSLCRKAVIIHAGHFTFGYLAFRYGLKYLSAYPGFTPDTEPTPQRLIEITKRVREYGSSYIFYEELIMPRVAESIAKETGARLLMLHGAHNVTKEEMERGVTFISIMEKSLENLKEGLECR